MSWANSWTEIQTCSREPLQNWLARQGTKKIFFFFKGNPCGSPFCTGYYVSIGKTVQYPRQLHLTIINLWKASWNMKISKREKQSPWTIFFFPFWNTKPHETDYSSTSNRKLGRAWAAEIYKQLIKQVRNMGGGFVSQPRWVGPGVHSGPAPEARTGPAIYKNTHTPTHG